jgi:hypothetical protein
MHARMRNCEGATCAFGNQINRVSKPNRFRTAFAQHIAGRGQEGPCLTDAARSAAPDVLFAEAPLRCDPNDAAAVIAAQIARGHMDLPMLQPVRQRGRTPDID